MKLKMIPISVYRKQDEKIKLLERENYSLKKRNTSLLNKLKESELKEKNNG